MSFSVISFEDNTLLPKILTASLIAACSLTLSGCLSKEEAVTDAEVASTEPPPATVQSGAPSIWGSPDSAVMTGETYVFEPNASDPNGAPLTFSVSGLPRWASFDSSDGELSGQPMLGDEGVYSDIRISVSNGTQTVSLRAFSIEVTQSALGSMSLSWTAPTENSDGTALTDLAGFRIYYGRSQGSYSNTIRIDNPSLSTYVVENLLPDTYYVVATSFNSLGVESAFSNEAVKTVAAD